MSGVKSIQVWRAVFTAAEGHDQDHVSSVWHHKWDTTTLFLFCSCPLICPFTPALSLCLSSSLHGLCPWTHSFTPQWDTAVCTYTFSMEMNAHTRSPTHSDTHISIALRCHDWWSFSPRGWIHALGQNYALIYILKTAEKGLHLI